MGGACQLGIDPRAHNEEICPEELIHLKESDERSIGRKKGEERGGHLGLGLEQVKVGVRVRYIGVVRVSYSFDAIIGFRVPTLVRVRAGGRFPMKEIDRVDECTESQGQKLYFFDGKLGVGKY